MARKKDGNNKDRMWIAFVFGLSLLIAGVLFLDYSKKQESAPPQTASSNNSSPAPASTPPSTLHAITSDAEIQSALDSGKPVVLYFYSPTCGTCVQAHDNVLALEEKLKAHDVRLLKVSYIENQAIFQNLGANISWIVAWKGKEVLKEPFYASTNLDEMLNKILQTLGISL